jgi:hypothetical protein
MVQIDPRSLETFIKDDLLTIACGKQLGSGVSRAVYEFNDDCVVKVEYDATRQGSLLQNAREMLVWREFSEYKVMKKWLAPCRYISRSGHWLIQEKTTPVTIDELRREAPRVPACFTDLKVANWGRLKGRIVCHDYGSLLLGKDPEKTRKAVWWEDK